MSVEAVRYYERLGLLAPAPRTNGGLRVYREGDLERIRFIKQAQRNGLSLKDIKSLLALGDKGKCKQVLKLLAERIRTIDHQLAELNSFREVLDGYAEKCREAQRRAGEPNCPVVDQLGKGRA